MRYVWWAVALVAAGVSAALWLFVASEVRARSVPVVPVVSTLPVVPVIRPADPVVAALWDDLQAGRAVCLDRYFSRRLPDGQLVDVEVQGRRVPCP